jgi:dienelactone hydrolase
MRRDIEFLSGGVTLRGFFEVPDGADGPVPVICFAHGFSGVKELFLEDISAAFAGQGFASVVWAPPGERHYWPRPAMDTTQTGTHFAALIDSSDESTGTDVHTQTSTRNPLSQ